MERAYAVGMGSVVIAQGDITQQSTDAIGNAANGSLLGGGGVDGAIHRAAGPELVAYCREVKKSLPGGWLETGQAVITPGFKLRAKHVVHCVGPVYDREGQEASRLLAACYANALRLCREHGVASIAMPSISTGVYGYPVEEAAPIALGAIRDALISHGHPRLVKMCLFDSGTFEAYSTAAEQVLR